MFFKPPEAPIISEKDETSLKTYIFLCTSPSYLGSGEDVPLLCSPFVSSVCFLRKLYWSNRTFGREIDTHVTKQKHRERYCTCIRGQVESSSSSLSSTQSGFSSESCEQITDWSRFSFTFSHSYLFVNCSNIKLCIKLSKLILKLIEFKFIVIFFFSMQKINMLQEIYHKAHWHVLLCKGQ